MIDRVARRPVLLAMSHLIAGLMGVAIVAVFCGRAVRASSGPMSALGLAWAASTDESGCKPDGLPWARSLVSHRSDLQEDDFAVEAAIALSLLGDSGGERLPAGERAALRDAATRCASVLHVPCEGPRFEAAVARRCREGPLGHVPRSRVFGNDAGFDAPSFPAASP